jgi:hypothetical protein
MLLDRLRTPFFIAAIILIGLAVLIELGSIIAFGGVSSEVRALDAPRPGRGIPALALLDGLVLYTTLIVGLALIVPERIQGRLQGLATLVFSILMLIAEIVMVLGSLVLLVLMVTLLLSPIFGTIAYFAIYGSFDTSGARLTLGLLMGLKLAFALCLVLAHQRFLQNKGLVLLVLSCLLGTFVVGLLHGIVPGVLVSITDDIGAIVVVIIAAIWTIVFLIASVVSVVKAVT